MLIISSADDWLLVLMFLNFAEKLNFEVQNNLYALTATPSNECNIGIILFNKKHVDKIKYFLVL